MKNNFNIRKVTALILTMICVFSTSVTAFASEVSLDNTVKDEQVARAVQTNEFSLANNDDIKTVELTKNIVAGSTKKKYQIVKIGSDCTVVVRFVNQKTNATYTLALTANGGEYREGIGVSIPAGTYTVSFASTPCIVLNCWCVFEF